MLGKSGLACLAIAVVTLVAGCPHNVPQDGSSGADAKQKGAKELTFENGESVSNGIVTYPGSDRTDWKTFEIPDKKVGTLDLKLTWKAPRPKLQLAFDVFDEWNGEVVSSKKLNKKRAKGSSKSAQIINAHGKYFIRVYAMGRGDAGKYTLSLEFSENVVGPAFDPLTLAVNDPPKLAEVPAVDVPCDEFAFDPKNKACANVCPKQGAPPGWPPCANVCPTPPDINNPKCWATMPCPNPPDRRVADCKGKFGKCVDINNPDPANPNCDNINYPPVTARIIKSEVSSDGVVITCGAGSGQGIGKGWTGKVLVGDSEKGLADIQIIRVDKSIVVGKAKLTPDQITANPNARFYPPPRSR